MASEKDRLGEKLHDVEKAREDQYFAKRDKELIEKLRDEQEKEFKQELKAAATLVCPRCGETLRARTEHDVHLDECPACGGLWLDRGELELLAKREEEGWFGRLFRARQSKT
jgi:uncharacterized protein